MLESNTLVRDNDDGKLDLAGAGLNLRVMLGNGDGSFQPQVEYPAGGYT
jgi:hypothetical protein